MKRLSFLLASVGAFILLNACGGTTADDAGVTGGLTASHFSITTQSASTAGTPFNFTVTALDASNNIVTRYAGQVDFSSTDGQALLPPPDATLTSGVGTFQATLNGAGRQTITVTDATTDSITGASKSIHVSTAALAHFLVAGPAIAASGTTFSFPVTAVDEEGNRVDSYSGMVHFTSTDGRAVLPADSGIANGVGAFFATMTSLGGQEITATDVNTALTGTSSSIDVLTAGALVIVSGQPPDGMIGQVYYGGLTEICHNFNNIGFVLEAAGGPRVRHPSFTWSSSGLPPGLSVDQLSFGTGSPVCNKFTLWVIDGKPTTAGTYTFTITASDSAESTSATYTIKIENAP